jgi:hypothetical protein
MSGGALGETVEDPPHLGHLLEADSAGLVVETERKSLFGDELVESVECHLIGWHSGGTGHDVMVPKGCDTGWGR